MINFCKGPVCPTSQLLLEYRNNKLAPSRSIFISEHLEECDFCGAEFDLYANVQQTDENVAPSEIPAHLLELADLLLNNRHKDSSLLDKLLIEDRGLRLTGA